MTKTVRHKLMIAAITVALASVTGCKSAQDDAAAKAAAIQKQQQDEALRKQQEAEKAQRDHDEAFRKQVEANKKKSKALNKDGSKVWRTYLP